MSASGTTGGLRIAGGLALPVAVALPGLVVRIAVIPLPAPVAAVTFAAAVVGAAFLLTWGAELAEIDLGEGLALALLALIAVLPEYAVDVVFAWKAGQDPQQYAPLALANMTGANRLLIGVGWSLVALIAIRVMRRDSKGIEAGSIRAVQLRPVQLVEVAFLGIASVYALTLALRPSLTWIDAVVLFAIFAAYLWRVRSAPRSEDEVAGEDEEEEDEASELFGPASRVAALPTAPRRVLTIFMLAAAAAIIVLVAEPFADSLVRTGSALHVDQFLLVQWVAPLASETPEFIAVILLAMKLQGASALGALISSKINQWTLLVGILPLVFAVSSGSLSGLPVDVEQREELLLTAAQSLFAIALILPGRLTSRGAWTLLTLFLAQFLAAWLLPPGLRGAERLWFSATYLFLAALLVVRHRSALRRVFITGFRRTAPTRPGSET